MAQFGRPSADTNNPGSYTNELGGSVDIFQSIDEAVASDADFVQSPLAPASAVYVTKLSTLEDPVSSTGHTVHYRYQKDAAAGAQIDLVVELRQDYVSEVSQGTLIASWTHNNIANGFVQANQALTGPQADAITDYGNLYLRKVFTQV